MMWGHNVLPDKWDGTCQKWYAESKPALTASSIKWSTVDNFLPYIFPPWLIQMRKGKQFVNEMYEAIFQHTL